MLRSRLASSARSDDSATKHLESVRPIGCKRQLGDEAYGVGHPTFSSSMVCLRQMIDSDEPEAMKNLPATWRLFSG